VLEELLKILEQDGVQQPSELARRLGISREMVEDMLRFLIRSGKVQQLPGSSFLCAQASCSGCGIAKACPQPAQVHSPHRQPR
jgi:hypothetical protein